MTNFIEPYQLTDITTLSGGETISITDVLQSPKRLVSVTFNWVAGAAPSTAENIIVTLDSGKGASYDVILKTVDPSTFGGGIYDWYWNASGDLGENHIFATGDHIKITYANTDDLAIGAVLTMLEV